MKLRAAVVASFVVSAVSASAGFVLAGCDDGECNPDTTRVFGYGVDDANVYTLVQSCEVIVPPRTMIVKSALDASGAEVIRGGPLKPAVVSSFAVIPGAFFFVSDDGRVMRVRADDGSIDVFDGSFRPPFRQDGDAVYWQDTRGVIMKATLEGRPLPYLADDGIERTPYRFAVGGGFVFGTPDCTLQNACPEGVIKRAAAGGRFERFAMVPGSEAWGNTEITALAARPDKIAFTIQLGLDTIYYEADAHVAGPARELARLEKSEGLPALAITGRGTVVACHGASDGDPFGAGAELLAFHGGAPIVLSNLPCHSGLTASERAAHFLLHGIEGTTQTLRFNVDP